MDAKEKTESPIQKAINEWLNLELEIHAAEEELSKNRLQTWFDGQQDR